MGSVHSTAAIHVSLEVAGCGEAGDVPLEVELVPAGLALGAVYE
jgi:hypothetical protein